jgi:hypothetical protein
MRSIMIYTFSANIIWLIKSRRVVWTGYVAWMAEKKNICGVFVGKPGRKRAVGRAGHRWEDNIRMNIREIG